MGSMDELEGRITALEVQMRNVREDAAAARVLAGGADRDVSALASRLDAQTRLLQALRETQVEDHEAIGGLQRKFSAFEGKFTDFEDRFSGLEGRFSGLEGRFAGLEDRFSGLEGKFTDFEGRFSGLEGGFAGLVRGQAIIIDLLRRRNGHEGEPPTSAE